MGTVQRVGRGGRERCLMPGTHNSGCSSYRSGLRLTMISLRASVLTLLSLSTADCCQQISITLRKEEEDSRELGHSTLLRKGRAQ